MTAAEHEALLTRGRFAEEAAHRRLTEAYAAAAAPDELALLTRSWSLAAKTLAALSPLAPPPAPPPVAPALDRARLLELAALPDAARRAEAITAYCEAVDAGRG